MTKSAMNLLATNKQYKNGLLTGMILAKKIADEKKAAGGKRIKGGFNFKKALAVAAGPLGWVWLARHKNDEELKEVKKKLEKYEPPPKPKKKQPEKIDFPDEEELYDDDDFLIDENEDFDLEDFE